MLFRSYSQGRFVRIDEIATLAIGSAWFGLERAMTREQFVVLFQDEVDRYGGGPEWAKAHGVSASSVYSVIHGRRSPMPAMIQAMKMKRVVSYEPI